MEKVKKLNIKPLRRLELNFSVFKTLVALYSPTMFPRVSRLQPRDGALSILGARFAARAFTLIELLVVIAIIDAVGKP